MDNQPQQQPTHRSLTGFVTKLVGDGATYGFINDEIFFPQTNVSGGPASVGDQVFAECEYSAHMPIKWNATSVKIINKAVSSGQQHHQGGSSGQLQQPVQQQDLINQQQFNQGSPSVAVTYQQHRQQRQQRQMMDIKPQDEQQQQNIDQSNQSRLLDHQHTNINNSNDIFGSSNTRPNYPMQPQQQPDGGGIQPFHDQPMGPPNFTYTSQLGSAFVQNQFLPAPFLPQQPPPMLPQQQPPQHLLSSNQLNNQQQQRHDKGNMGGRFNNHASGDIKNDRQQMNRRNMNRNDNNKFDRPRSNDRDSNRQLKNNSREKSTGRVSKRDDIPVRPSPPPQSSAKSTTSVSSDKSRNRRHYEVQNIPKIQIMSNLNAYNMKQRCHSSVHVPSDLKNVIVNSYFRLDLKNTPKPILFDIQQKKDSKSTKDSNIVSSETKDIEPSTLNESQSTQIKQEDSSDNLAKKVSKSSVVELQSLGPRSDIKLNHKYGVKVILISLPEFEIIYHSVFGSKLDSFNTEGKFSYKKLDELITLLCNKGSNNGYSLIGGKFDPVLDGFTEGESNDFERHGRKPDLIATCKRILMEQIGLDLSDCRSWTLLSTFMYNNKSDYFSSKASIEYSYIYMPELWTMLTNKFDTKTLDKTKDQQQLTADEPTNTEGLASVAEPLEQKGELPVNAECSTPEDSHSVVTEPAIIEPSIPNEAIDQDNLNDLKVNDLKVELDKRDIKYKTGIKKAELIALLQESIKLSGESQQLMGEQEVIEQLPGSIATIENDKQDEIKMDDQDETTMTADVQDEERQLEEGEVLPETNSPSENSDYDDLDEMTIDGKRKSADHSMNQISKKLCGVKGKHVNLIKDSFTVYSSDQQLSLVPLYEATQAGRYDQFELSVASNILKESLVQHFSEYILTALVEDYRQKISTPGGSAQTSSSQDTNSDTNNNNTNNKSSTTIGNTTSSNNSNSSSKNLATSTINTTNTKEYPIDRYINLAFTYFDSSHMGYVYFEDLNKLFNNTGLTISKRALMALVGDGEKFNYKTLSDLSPKLPPTYIYEFPIQFEQLPGTISQTSLSNTTTSAANVKLVEHKGIVYDVEKLIQQVKDAETLNVSLIDRFNYAIENSDKQTEEIHILEVSQKSLSKAIKAQNDEICDLKRERDSMKKKYESVKKGVKGAIGSLSDLIKEEK